MRYHGNVIRPPSEAASLILQVMYGCSHGRCTFCGSYLDKSFQLRTFDDITADVRGLPSATKAHIRQVFLCDGDALALPVGTLLKVLDMLTAELPALDGVSAYANAHSLLRRSPDQLAQIRSHGLELLYLGLESGDEETLKKVGKGVTVAEQIRACTKAAEAGFSLSVTAILGLGGEARWLEHAQGTAAALSAIDPQYIGILSLMLEPGTVMAREAQTGRFVMPGPLALLRELREMIAGIDATDAIFRSNHASNYVSVNGRFPKDKVALLRALDEALGAPDKLHFKPEAFRAL
jgi:radical SAM superfamily enzyme YgiQ (UPF0313 family)